jgi:hypothetical protein
MIIFKEDHAYFVVLGMALPPPPPYLIIIIGKLLIATQRERRPRERKGR